MNKKSLVLILHCFLLLLFIVACGDDNVDEDLDAMLDTLNPDQSGEALVELLETAYEEEPYEDELAAAKAETEKTMSGLQSLELSTDKGEELRDSFVSSLEDFQTIIDRIESKGPDLSDEDWQEIEEISAEANEKQMELVREKFERMDMEIPEDAQENNE